MAYADIVARIDYPKWWSARYKKMDALERLHKGTLYNVLQFPFSQEEEAGGREIPMDKRRPAVQYPLPKIIVDQTSALTFGEAHTPAVRIAKDDPDMDPKKVAADHEQFERIIEALDLDAVMLEAMKKGCYGSAAAILRVLPDGFPWIELVEGKYCLPMYDPRDPRKIISMEQIYDVTAEDLTNAGYEGKYDPNKKYFIRILYDKDWALCSKPMREDKFRNLGKKMHDEETGNEIVVAWQPDKERSYRNPLDEINVIWIKNLPTRFELDGECTFEAIADITVEIAYMLSQIGRGYRYTADPVFVEKAGEMQTSIPLMEGDPNAENRPKTSPARWLKIDGEAAVLEISGEGLRGAGDYVKMLREYGMEAISGMKSDAENSRGPQSGSALHQLQQALVWLVERFRTSYGTRGYLELLKMTLRGLLSGDIEIDNVDVSGFDGEMPLHLVWPQWSAPAGPDLLAEIQALAAAAGSTPMFPKAILPMDIIAQKAAAAVGINDVNRVAAEMAAEHEENPPLTPRDKMEADNKVAMHKNSLDHENNKAVTAQKVQNMAAESKVKQATMKQAAKSNAS